MAKIRAKEHETFHNVLTNNKTNEYSIFFFLFGSVLLHLFILKNLLV
jgi:hypothetical protein